ncbi:MAG: (2Fe-2S) ferredoxin domain-containing protein [Planctomycetes bacterium]|nr:(2Fe-2S) ferredoxin domain-containing protein [Planctomycetota bacterium]
MNSSPCPFSKMMLVCLNERPAGEPSCGGRGSKAVADALKKLVNDRGLKGTIRVTKTHCLGLCELGPNVIVYPDGTLFSGVAPADVPAILDKYVKPEAK